MFNPIIEAKNVETRRRELLRQAKLQALIREARRDQAKLHERMLRLVGELMVSGGTKLVARYQRVKRERATWNGTTPRYGINSNV